MDIVKIDRSFIETGGSDGVLRGIVQLGHALGLELIAEGIEDVAQAEALRELGCPLGQGFHFWRPLAAVEVAELLVSLALPHVRRAS